MITTELQSWIILDIIHKKILLQYDREEYCVLDHFSHQYPPG